MLRRHNRRRLSVQALETRRLMAGDSFGQTTSIVIPDEDFAELGRFEAAARSEGGGLWNTATDTFSLRNADDGAAQRINQISSYIDASNVYGSDSDKADAIDTVMANSGGGIFNDGGSLHVTVHPRLLESLL